MPSSLLASSTAGLHTTQSHDLIAVNLIAIAGPFTYIHLSLSFFLVKIKGRLG